MKISHKSVYAIILLLSLGSAASKATESAELAGRMDKPKGSIPVLSVDMASTNTSSDSVSTMASTVTALGAKPSSTVESASITTASIDTLDSRPQDLEALKKQDLVQHAHEETEKAVNEDLNLTAGKIVKRVGLVEVLDELRQSDDESSGSELLPNSVVQTSEDSRAYIKLIDGSKIVLRENSSIRLNGFSEVGVEKGKVLFSVEKRSKDIFKVATKIALLGVRGTSFLVDQSGKPKDLNVHLKEGLVDVSAKEGSFEYFRKSEKDEFEAYQKEFNQQFEQYKEEQAKEFREFVKQIEMKANDVLSISNNQVRKTEWSGEFDAWFDEFESSVFD